VGKAKFDNDYTDFKESASTNILAIDFCSWLRGSLNNGAGFVISDLRV